MAELGRWLILVGAVLILIGAYLRLGGSLPPVGRLPGDILIQRPGMVIWIPITTMILLSLVLTALARVLGRW